MNSRFKSKYPPVPYSITNLEFGKDTARDTASPFSLLEFIKVVSRLTDSANITDYYNDYIVLWDNKQQLKSTDAQAFFVYQYTEFIKDITLKYSTESERKFLSSIDYTDKYDLDIILSFISRKIKEIALYYSKVREDIKHETTRKKLKSSSKGLVITIKERILDFFRKKEIVGFNINENIQKININIDELYDAGSEYLDKQPTPYIYDNADRDYDLDIFLASNNDLLSLVYGNMPSVLQQYQEVDQVFEKKKDLTTKYMGADFYYLSATPIYSQVPKSVTGTIIRGRIEEPVKIVPTFKTRLGWNCTTINGKKVCVEAVNGVYATESECKAACKDEIKYGWNCITIKGVKGCAKVINGAYETEEQCKKACKTTIKYGWNCVILNGLRRCNKVVNGFYATEEQCKAVCNPPTTKPPTTKPPVKLPTTKPPLSGTPTTKPPTTKPPLSAAKYGYDCILSPSTDVQSRGDCQWVINGTFKTYKACEEACYKETTTTKKPGGPRPSPCKKQMFFMCSGRGRCVPTLSCTAPLSSFESVEECSKNCTTKPPEPKGYTCYQGQCRESISPGSVSKAECQKSCTTKKPGGGGGPPVEPDGVKKPKPAKVTLVWKCLKGRESPTCVAYKTSGKLELGKIDKIPEPSVVSRYSTEQECMHACRVYWVCRGTHNRRVERVTDTVHAPDPRSKKGIYETQKQAEIRCNLGYWRCAQEETMLNSTVPRDLGPLYVGGDNAYEVVEQTVLTTQGSCYMVANPTDMKTVNACMLSDCFRGDPNAISEYEVCDATTVDGPGWDGTGNPGTQGCTTCNPCMLKVTASLHEVRVNGPISVGYDTRISITNHTLRGGPCQAAWNYSYSNFRSTSDKVTLTPGVRLLPGGSADLHARAWAIREEFNDKVIPITPAVVEVDWSGAGGAGTCKIAVPRVEALVPWKPNTDAQDITYGDKENTDVLRSKLGSPI